MITKGGGGLRGEKVITFFYFFILCNISAEFYFNFKFMITIIMYSNCAITLKHLWFILKNVKVFNEMEINVIDNKVFINIYLKIRVRGKKIA